MNIGIATTKNINELEQQISQLLKTLKTAKLQGHSIYSALYEFEQELGESRRARFDENNPEYRGF